MKKRFFLNNISLFTGLLMGIMIAVPLSKLVSKQSNAYSVIESKFKVMNQMLYYVNQLYYKDVDMESLLDGALSGIMEELDPHSVFISAKDQKLSLIHISEPTRPY